ncbi:MAG: type II secretion system F family protein [Desulfosarcinaceae bacterium]|nr:type II secretion system F family protein [Desulfosarcinaceae bacterium]
MPQYAYEVINANGTHVRGVLEAESTQDANAVLASRGYIPIKVRLQHGESGFQTSDRFRQLFIRIKTHEVILFTKQLRTLVRAGVPVMTIFQALENQTESPALKRIVTIISRDVREGASYFDAFRKHPKAFSPLYCSMIQAGEASGALPRVLDRLIELIEHEDTIRSNIRSALRYPIIVTSFLFVAFIILLTFVVPKFVTILERSNMELPLPTRISIFMYDALSNYWALILVALVAAGFGLNAYLRTSRGKLVRDRLYLSMPLVGPLLIKAAMSRFASIFSILQASGVAVLECLKILSGTINNTAIAAEFDQIGDRLEEGRGISGPLRSSVYFPPLVINMIGIGEESGNLEDMLNEISDHYDAEVEYSMQKLSEAIGPILTLALAAVIGFFALAIYLPMWNMSQMAG